MRKKEKIFHWIMHSLSTYYRSKFEYWCDGKNHDFHIYKDKNSRNVLSDEELKEILETYNLPYEEKNYTYVIKREAYSKMTIINLQQIIALLKLNGVDYK